MTDQLRAQLVDSDLPFHCAYSLPAVALTLGRDHWPLLKPTFTLLATDMQVQLTADSHSYILANWLVASHLPIPGSHTWFPYLNTRTAVLGECE